MQLRVVNVTLVMTDGPLGSPLSANGIFPSEPYDARTNGDSEPAALGFDAQPVPSVRPWFGGLKKCRC